LESADFYTTSTELRTISQCKAEIVAGLALSSPIPACFSGGQREEIHEILAGVIVKDVVFSLSLMLYLAHKLPCVILLTRLAGLTDTGQIPQDLLQQACVMADVPVRAFAAGLAKTYEDAESDLAAWFRANSQSGDVVNDFSRFLATFRTQHQQTLISQMTTLFRDSLLAIPGCQEAWDSLVERTRAILSLPDSELYPVITPASLQGCLE
jgi:hypothetical protein